MNQSKPVLLVPVKSGIGTAPKNPSLFIHIILTSLVAMIPFCRATAQTSGIVWEQERLISSDSLDVGGQRIIAVGETLHVFWQSYPTEADNMIYVRSTNGGVTWSPPFNLYSEDFHNSGTTKNLAIANDFLYVYWQTCDTCNGNPNHYWTTFRRSLDGGISFETPRREFPGGPVALCAGDSVVVRIFSDPGNHIQISRDLGETWDTHALVSRDFQQLFLDSLRTLHMLQPATGTLAVEVSYSRSLDLGLTWGAETILSTGNSFVSAPEDARIAVSGDDLLAVWRDGKYGSTNGFTGSLLARRSTNGGMTWEGEVRLTDIPSAIGQHVIFSRNRAAVVWHNESQPFRGISLRFSDDFGVTWSGEEAVSDSLLQAFDPDVALTGDYIQVVWSDKRAGRSQTYFRRGRLASASVRSHPGWAPEDFQLYQNYPNPFNPSTTISFSIPRTENVSLKVYDLLGREVATLVDGRKEAGEHSVKWNAEGFASGVYFCRLKAGDFVQTRKLVLVR
jgi:hypothetical protein